MTSMLLSRSSCFVLNISSKSFPKYGPWAFCYQIHTGKIRSASKWNVTNQEQIDCYCRGQVLFAFDRFLQSPQSLMARAAKSKHVNTTQTLRRKLVSANSTFGSIAVSGLVVPCLYHPCMRISITCIDGLIRFNLWEGSNKIFLFCHWDLTFCTHCNQIKFLLGSTKETCMCAIVKHTRSNRLKTLNWSLPTSQAIQ